MKDFSGEGFAGGDSAVLMEERLGSLFAIPRRIWADRDTQRQTVVSQFFQLDRLVVEGGKSV